MLHKQTGGLQTAVTSGMPATVACSGRCIEINRNCSSVTAGSLPVYPSLLLLPTPQVLLLQNTLTGTTPWVWANEVISPINRCDILYPQRRQLHPAEIVSYEIHLLKSTPQRVTDLPVTWYFYICFACLQRITRINIRLYFLL